MVARVKNPSSYNLFTKAKYQQLKVEQQGITFPQAQKIISAEWKTFDKAKKDSYKSTSTISIKEAPTLKPAPSPAPPPVYNLPSPIYMTPKPTKSKKSNQKTIETIIDVLDKRKKQQKVLKLQNRGIKLEKPTKIVRGGLEKERKPKPPPSPSSSESESDDLISDESTQSEDLEEELYKSSSSSDEEPQYVEDDESSSSSEEEEESPQVQPIRNKSRFF
jgi:hypothetical protein